MANYSEHDLKRWEVESQLKARKVSIDRYLIVASHFRIDVHPILKLVGLSFKEQVAVFYKDHKAILQRLKELGR